MSISIKCPGVHLRAWKEVRLHRHYWGSTTWQTQWHVRVSKSSGHWVLLGTLLLLWNAGLLRGWEERRMPLLR